MTSQSRQVRLARLGALIDGEGTISITTHNRREPGSGKLYPLKMTYITLSNTDEAMPREFLEFFATGHMIKSRPRVNGKLYRTVYRWKEVGKKAAAVIEALLPYLVQKRPQAELALDFQATQTQSRAPGVQEHKREVQAVLLAEMRALNRRGVGCEGET